MSEWCVCGSGKVFKNCCDRFLNQQQFAKTPEQLMRSRYSAYALGGYGEYLLSTWAPNSAPGLSATELSMQSTDWVSLDVLNKSQKGNSGVVEFKASFIDKNKKPGVHHEISRFERIADQWFYVSGEVLAK